MASIRVEASSLAQQVEELVFEFLTILNFANGFSVKLLHKSSIFVLWVIEVELVLAPLVTTIESASRHFFEVISVYQETRNFFVAMPIKSNFA